MPIKTWTAGEVLAAADVMTYLMNQTVMTFASDAARTSALPSPTEGMISYLSDTDALETYSGSAWVGLDTLPSQTGEANKYLTTNGTTASWAAIVTDPNPQIFMMMGA